MRDPAELVDFLAQPGPGERPVLIEALDGFVDCGQAVLLARAHLTDSFEPETIVSFDVDQLLDHRARRPLLLFDTDHWEAYEAPALTVQRHRDAAGAPFLVLAGPEPDVQWERFIAAVLVVIERLHVPLTVGLHSVPWAAPHTRPIAITSHGQPRELLAPPPFEAGKVRVPASVGHLLEYRLGQAGHASIGFAAHTPYYLAQVEYPAAAVALLESLERTAGLSLSLEPLRARGLEVQEAIDSQMAGDEQVRSVVRELEERDEALFGYGVSDDGAELPTGDELGAEFERFLAERARRAASDEPPA
jgi:PAC2 family